MTAVLGRVAVNTVTQGRFSFAWGKFLLDKTERKGCGGCVAHEPDKPRWRDTGKQITGCNSFYHKIAIHTIRQRHKVSAFFGYAGIEGKTKPKKKRLIRHTIGVSVSNTVTRARRGALVLRTNATVSVLNNAVTPLGLMQTKTVSSQYDKRAYKPLIRFNGKAWFAVNFNHSDKKVSSIKPVQGVELAYFDRWVLLRNTGQTSPFELSVMFGNEERNIRMVFK